VATDTGNQRRSLRYIRLAAYLAGQPQSTTKLVMSLSEIEDLVGATLPPGARFPSWWRNDERRMHSRAWLAAGWEVEKMNSSERSVEFRRRA